MHPCSQETLREDVSANLCATQNEYFLSCELHEAAFLSPSRISGGGFEFQPGLSSINFFREWRQDFSPRRRILVMYSPEPMTIEEFPLLFSGIADQFAKWQAEAGAVRLNGDTTPEMRQCTRFGAF